jgi:hypothetical protein
MAMPHSTPDNFTLRYNFSKCILVGHTIACLCRHRKGGLQPIHNLSTRKGWVVSTTARKLCLLERPGAHCVRGLMGPAADLDEHVKSRLHRDSIPGSSCS